METNEIIDKAINILQTDGWTQGDFYKDGKYCVLGALYKAAGYDYKEPYENPAYESPVKSYDVERMLFPIQIKLRECLNIRPTFSVVHWNDKSDRTVEDVISALECAKE